MMETRSRDEALLRLAAHFVIEAGVVGLRVKAPVTQARGQIFGVLARKGVDDGGFTFVLLQQPFECGEGVFLRQHAIAEVGAVETGDELLRFV